MSIFADAKWSAPLFGAPDLSFLHTFTGWQRALVLALVTLHVGAGRSFINAVPLSFTATAGSHSAHTRQTEC